MAEIQAAAQPRSTKPRAKKHAFRLDMTPMVDLAFLLLTFFMLTTTFSKPNVMQLTMPAKPTETEASFDLVSSDALTVLLDAKGKVYYYYGLNDGVTVPELHTTDFSAEGLRQVLLEQQQRRPRTVVLIKPTDAATYRDMVDALDELTIAGQKKYALVDTDAHDLALLNR